MPTALITGGAKRVGRAIALRLAKGGFDIAITYYSSDREADQACEEIRGLGREAIAMGVDLTDAVTAPSLVFDWVQEHFGRLDVLVNNASLYQTSSLQSATPEQMGRLFAIHFQTPMELARRFEPMLRASKGRIVNMLDLLAERPWPEYLAYCASKAALWNLTLGLARALAPEVTVNGIAPGVVEWPEGYPEAEKEKYLRRVPLGRSGRPEDVAEAVFYLATAGSYVTGQVIRLDGGRSIT
jgi:pteridine reductase